MPDNIETNRVEVGDIEEKLLSVIRNHCLSDAKESISLSSTLESTGIDSLGMAEAAFDLEDIFGFELPDPKSVDGQFSTVQDIYDVIVKYIDKK